MQPLDVANQPLSFQMRRPETAARGTYVLAVSDSGRCPSRRAEFSALIHHRFPNKYGHQIRIL